MIALYLSSALQEQYILFKETYNLSKEANILAKEAYIPPKGAVHSVVCSTWALHSLQRSLHSVNAPSTRALYSVCFSSAPYSMRAIRYALHKHPKCAYILLAFQAPYMCLYSVPIFYPYILCALYAMRFTSTLYVPIFYSLFKRSKCAYILSLYLMRPIAYAPYILCASLAPYHILCALNSMRPIFCALHKCPKF